MELTIKLQAFEGPLDLLLHLLDKNKVSIYDIPIVEITNQYLEYIREISSGNTSMTYVNNKEIPSRDTSMTLVNNKEIPSRDTSMTFVDNKEIPSGDTSMTFVDNKEIPSGDTSMTFANNKEIQRQDLNIMSEFLVMAATLIAIKSKMLLPKEVNEDGETEDPRAELVQQLLEYKMYKCMSYELRDRQVDAARILYKAPTVPSEVLAYEEPVDVEKLMSGITLNKLNGIFQSVMRRQENKIDKVRAGFGKIEKEEVSLSEKMAYLEQYAASHRRFRFRNLLESQGSKMEIIVCFLAVLELIKMGKITITQENLFDDIEIESKAAA